MIEHQPRPLRAAEQKKLEQLFCNGDTVLMLDAQVKGMRDFAERYNDVVREEIRSGKSIFFGEPDYLPQVRIHRFGRNRSSYTYNDRIQYFEAEWINFLPTEHLALETSVQGLGLGESSWVELEKTNSSIFFIPKGNLAGVIVNRVDVLMALRWQAITSGEISFNLPEYNGILPTAQILQKRGEDRIQYHSRNDKADVYSFFSGHSNRLYYAILMGEDTELYGHREGAREKIKAVVGRKNYRGFQSKSAYFRTVALVDEIEQKIDRLTKSIEQAGVVHHDLGYNWCVSYCAREVYQQHFASGGTINTLPPQSVTYNPLLKIADPEKYETIVRLIDLDSIEVESSIVEIRYIEQLKKNVLNQFKVLIDGWANGDKDFNWFSNQLAGISLWIFSYCDSDQPDGTKVQKAIHSIIPEFRVMGAHLFNQADPISKQFSYYLLHMEHYSMSPNDRIASMKTFQAKKREFDSYFKQIEDFRRNQ